MDNTQSSYVLKELMSGKSVTSVQAFQKWGATRLSAIIFNIRKQGIPVITVMKETKTRYGHICKYAEYHIDKDYLKGVNKHD